MAIRWACIHYCDFCGKREPDVAEMIAGPGVDICSECIALCVERLEEAKKERTPRPSHSTKNEHPQGA